MGCDSFSEFKVYFKQYQESLQLSPRSYDGSEIRDFFKRNDTPEFQAQVEKMANVLQSAKVVIFVGIGNSAMTAQYAARYFANSGKFTSDRTIQEYVDDIWHLDKVTVDMSVVED